MKLLVEKGTDRVIGYIEGAGSIETGVDEYVVPAPPNFDPSMLSVVSIVNGEVVLDYSSALSKLKALKVDEIKQAASQAINSLNWRLERAKEREQLGVTTGETVADVLSEREAIRIASNRVEAEIANAVDVAAVNAIVFEVTPADRTAAKATKVSRVDFMARFTQAEMEAIVQAAKTTPSVEAMLLKWQAADGVSLTSPETQMAVNAIETAGILNVGRAKEILTT